MVMSNLSISLTRDERKKKKMDLTIVNGVVALNNEVQVTRSTSAERHQALLNWTHANSVTEPR